GSVQRNDGRRRERRELVVEGYHLGPVGRRRVVSVGVHCVDCSLDLVRTRPVQLETLSDQHVPFLDLSGVPARSVLVGQDDEMNDSRPCCWCGACDLRARVPRIGVGYPTRAWRPSWTPIWTPSPPHCTCSPTTCCGITPNNSRHVPGVESRRSSATPNCSPWRCCRPCSASPANTAGSVMPTPI